MSTIMKIKDWLIGRSADPKKPLTAAELADVQAAAKENFAPTLNRLVHEQRIRIQGLINERSIYAHSLCMDYDSNDVLAAYEVRSAVMDSLEADGYSVSYDSGFAGMRFYHRLFIEWKPK